MTIDEALRIVEALATGCDPRTGEELVPPQIVLRRDAAEALVTVAEALQVVRSAVVAPEATLPDSSPEPQGDSPSSVYDAARVKFGVHTTGGPSRFAKPGWFYVGQAVASCPECQTPMEAFRCPYTTSAGLRYHYWALLCVDCAKLFQSADLGPMRKGLYDSSEHRPSDESRS